MRIVHLCKNDHGGAGNAAYRLNSGLKLLGVDSRMLVMQRKKTCTDINVFKGNDNIWTKLFLKCLDRRITSDFQRYSKSRPKGLEIFTDDRSLFNIEADSLIQNADIIHLHWIARMVNYQKFFPRILGKPIVWTLHDMNPFTGGCHYTGECKKYETVCGACPQLGSKTTNDLANEIMDRKGKAYSNQNIYCVTPSKWLAECAKKSRLMGQFTVQPLHNGIPVSEFAKQDKTASRKKLNLPVDKTVLLFGADDATSERKGLKYVIEALKLLAQKMDCSIIAPTVFGSKAKDIVKDCGLPIYSVNSVPENLMPICYSAADFFIIASIEDNLPNTVLESLACETPVIGFDVGGISEMIIHGENGLLAKLKNAQDFSEKIQWMINNPEERKQMGMKGRQLVENKFTTLVQATEYYKLYKSIIAENQMMDS